MTTNGLMTSIHSLTAKTKLVGLASLVIGVMLAGLLAAPSAHAQPLGCPTSSSTFGICAGSFTSSSSNNQAGAHSDFTTGFQLNTDNEGNVAGQLKNVSISLPPGEVGDPQAIPHCTDNEFQNFSCPADAQVGILNANLTVTPGSHTTLTQPTFGPTSLTSNIATCGGFGGCSRDTFTVADSSHLNVGDFITICGALPTPTAPCDTQPGGMAEHLTIRSISGDTIVADTDGPVQSTCGPDTSLPTSVNFCPGFGTFYPHASGDNVFDETIHVVSTAGFTGTDFLKIGSQAAGDLETNQTNYFPSNGVLDLQNPMQFTHTGCTAPCVGENVDAQADTQAAPIPLFNMQPDPGHVATLSGTFLFVTITIEVDVHSPGSTTCVASTCQLVGTLSSASTLLTLEGSSLTLWGVPGDPSHDSQRCGENLAEPNCQPSAVSKAPFLTNPTNCSAGGTTSVTATPYQGQSSTVTMPVTPPTGCDELSMSPTLSVAPDTSQADTPAGYDVDLKVPQNEEPYSLATPEVQNVSITLPTGTALSPPVANGLEGCSDAQFAANSCPDASKVGTVSIHTPLLPDLLTGSAYIGSPTPGQMYRLFLIASGNNVTIQLSGQAIPDPSTGQLTTVFNQNPQLPFDELNVSLFGGPYAALANPESCGTFTTTSDISSWAGGPDATPSGSFNITSCDPAFAPTFTAGTVNPTAGAYSPFTLTFSRQDSDAELSTITATLPPGLLAAVGTVPLCPDANASAGTCGAASQVGTATVGSGAGSQPLFLSGPVYLTGPYKGAPYGLAEVIQAIAGPYNLGTVVVRQAVNIDPTDAHVTAVSDPFPTILDGVPLRIKTVNLTLNRPNFIINPTSCAPGPITGTITSVGGTNAAVSSPFQLGFCRTLPFFPSLGLRLTGKGRTTSGTHPTLTATLAEGSGQANIASAKVTLPLSLALDPTNSTVVCPYAVAQAVHGGAVNCPADTIVGSATATSPLLSAPLAGPVYLVQGIRFNSAGQQIRTLPTLLVPLRGQIALDLRATTSVSGGHLVSTFGTVPDAPVSSFALTISGGSRGILVVTGRGRSICRAPQLGNVAFGAHSGRNRAYGMTVATPACTGTHSRKR